MVPKNIIIAGASCFALGFLGAMVALLIVASAPSETHILDNGTFVGTFIISAVLFFAGLIALIAGIILWLSKDED